MREKLNKSLIMLFWKNRAPSRCIKLAMEGVAYNFLTKITKKNIKGIQGSKINRRPETPQEVDPIKSIYKENLSLHMLFINHRQKYNSINRRGLFKARNS